MALILADVGGTNVRFACAREGVIQSALIKSYQNDDYASFDVALAAFKDYADIESVQALTVAVAGPVTGPTARLTNRDWHFDTQQMSAGNGGATAHLMNDLSALGYALDDLDGHGTSSLVAVKGHANGEMQRLVVGMGTGFNVSPVLSRHGKTTCLLAEAGLSSLPTRVMRVLNDYLDGNTDWVTCVEDVLSGPGLSRLHAAATHGPSMSGKDIVTLGAQGEPQACKTLEVFARMLGELVQDFRLQYMPMGGIFMAGSVVRAVFESPARDIFIETVRAQPTRKSTLPEVPISVITQDEAALLGCLAYAKSHI